MYKRQIVYALARKLEQQQFGNCQLVCAALVRRDLVATQIAGPVFFCQGLYPREVGSVVAFLLLRRSRRGSLLVFVAVQIIYSYSRSTQIEYQPLDRGNSQLTATLLVEERVIEKERARAAKVK